MEEKWDVVSEMTHRDTTTRKENLAGVSDGKWRRFWDEIHILKGQISALEKKLSERNSGN